MDPSPGEVLMSYSRPDLVAVTHTHLRLTVEFDRHVLEGKATLTVHKKTSTCNEVLVLDTYKLNILRVKDYQTKDDLTVHIENHDDNFGSKLIIELPNEDRADRAVPTSSKERNVIKKYEIEIKYETKPESPALYWLKPHQTSDGIHPLLISNSKLMYARAIFPCQDTPSNSFTFSSMIIVPKGLNVIMPGFTEKSKARNSCQDQYKFSLRSFIRPHEIYIIVGSLKEVGIYSSERHLKCNLWAEEKYFQQGTMALNEIVDMLYNIKLSHGFLGAVNVCVLPPNIPEFDMQYPYMTYVSSTLLEGHYSMIDTIVQSIIESWIGRGVKIDDFKYLWLVKGLSTFIHRNPINEIFNKEMYDFLEIKGFNNLLNMQHLHTVSLTPNFTGELLPMNIIKYVSEKGCVFLNYLQDILGPTDVKHFFVHRCVYASLTTDRFKNSLYEYLYHKRELLDSVEWDGWLYRPGFPPSCIYHDSMTRPWKTTWHLKTDRWVEQKEVGHNLIQEVHRTNNFVKIEFLTYLHALPAVPKAKLKILEYAFLGEKEICEIRFLWLRLCIKSKWLEMQMPALKFASTYCMPKYACPIFRDLYNLDQTSSTRIMARSWFMEPDNRSKMLPETIKELASILEVELNELDGTI